MKNLTNLTFTLFLMLVFPILESCELNQECGGSLAEYYDYSALEIEQNESENDDSDPYVYFSVYPVVEFESNISTTYGSSLMADNLMLIPTHEIESVKIISSHPFESAHPDELDITDHFEFYHIQEWVSMEEAHLGDNGRLYIRCTALPDDLDQNYDLEFEILKSNNEIATGRLSNVTF